MVLVVSCKASGNLKAQEQLEKEQHEIWKEEARIAAIKAEKNRIATTVGGVLNTEGTGNLFNKSEGWAAFFRGYHGPRIRVHEIKLDGPYYNSWPTPSYKALFGEYEPTMQNARAILKRFASACLRFQNVSDCVEAGCILRLVRGGRLPRHKSGQGGWFPWA